MKVPITTRFCIWSKGGTVLYEETDFNEVRKKINLKSTELLLSIGDKIVFDEKEREITEINFRISASDRGPQCQIVVSINEDYM